MGWYREPSKIKFTSFDDLNNVMIDVCDKDHQVLIRYAFPELSHEIRYILYTNEEIDQQEVIVKAYRNGKLIATRYLPCKN
jgi:hypothetical protein